MSDFESLWKAAVRFRRVSHGLKTLVFQVVTEGQREPVDLVAVRYALDRLLSFLASPVGRTDPNCCAVDRLFANYDGAWRHLPAPLANVLADMSGTLHDTIYAPQIAAHFDSLPEQLLNRLRKIQP